MGKGGPLAFLNKKPWHPANARNQEEIWKREQDYLAEVAKRDELRKQIEEEREREGFDDFVVKATHQQKQEKVEWMYQSGLAAQEEASKRQEEHLLGKPVEQLPQEAAPDKIDVLAGGSGVDQGPKALSFSANETWNRLNEDPLLLIKRSEMGRMSQAKAELKQQLRVQSALKPKKEKKEKKEKKSKKAAREDRAGRDGHRRHRDGSSPDVSPGVPEQRRDKRHWHDSAEGQHADDHRSSRRRSRYSSDDDDGEHASHGGPSRRHHQRSSPVPSRRDVSSASLRHSREDASDRGGRRADREQASQANDGDHRAAQHSHDGRHRSRHSPPPRHGHEAPVPSRRRDDDAADGCGSGGREHRSAAAARGSRQDDASVMGSRDREYGLRTEHLPERARHRESRAELTHESIRIKQAEKRREEEEQAQRAAKARKKYTPGKLTEEQKAERLAAMTDAAQGIRASQLKSVADEDAAERADGARYQGQDLQQGMAHWDKSVLNSVSRNRGR